MDSSVPLAYLLGDRYAAFFEQPPRSFVETAHDVRDRIYGVDATSTERETWSRELLMERSDWTSLEIAREVLVASRERSAAGSDYSSGPLSMSDAGASRGGELMRPMTGMTGASSPPRPYLKNTAGLVLPRSPATVYKDPWNPRQFIVVKGAPPPLASDDFEDGPVFRDEPASSAG
eukprot:CAMPEP_0118875462 /NCGR_PEP_ID=MMETSP1163-20130328/16530_1 /TAXON_ID=124430 /ORGANISM="Phaeomonas parva, Strain CCMP2877" /LENGTH=175 /DNA_ID=CAMNT_0006810973 /DNA_START=398 /DNA_END=922 /DNA_ORIENTATION=+